ncbi:MAG: hypothetical protein IT521_02440 [Burkholderiales bacterium]|nr:hypothetical protein [Burkholderiales bacterium]
MTVEKVNIDAGNMANATRCVWFHNGERRDAVFPAASLEQATSRPGIA